MVLFAPGWGNHLQAQERILIKEGDLFPEVVLKPPVDSKDRIYLGISGEAPFAVKDIKAKVILVEIMNVYCASCQNMAPIYNKLYTLIDSQPEIRKQIKIIGIAAGNDDQEIKIYRDHFQVPFPFNSGCPVCHAQGHRRQPDPFLYFGQARTERKNGRSGLNPPGFQRTLRRVAFRNEVIDD